MENQQLQQQSNVFPIILSVLLSAVIFGAGGYYFANTTKTTAPSASTTTPSSQTPTNQYKNVYESLDFTGLNFAVPTTWSIYKGGDIQLPVGKVSAQPILSVGEKDVSFGDWNVTQVDFYASSGDIATKLVAGAKAQDSQHWAKETVGGIVSDVYTHPLENGQVTKGGTGGKDYYISLAGTKATFANQNIKTLVIMKQAQGDAAFESGSQHLIQSLQFAK